MLLSLGTKLKAIRISKKLNATNVAKTVGINRSYLSKIENGHEKPSMELLEKLIRHYALSVVEATELSMLAGYRSESVAAQITKGGEYLNLNMENQKSNP